MGPRVLFGATAAAGVVALVWYYVNRQNAQSQAPTPPQTQPQRQAFPLVNGERTTPGIRFSGLDAAEQPEQSPSAQAVAADRGHSFGAFMPSVRAEANAYEYGQSFATSDQSRPEQPYPAPQRRTNDMIYRSNRKWFRY